MGHVPQVTLDETGRGYPGLNGRRIEVLVVGAITALGHDPTETRVAIFVKL